MSTTYLSVDYFPLTVNFFDRDAIELAEAKYGIRVDGAVCKLLCKIFKEGYYIPWGEEQSLIFARKLGGELKGKEIKQTGIFEGEMANALENYINDAKEENDTAIQRTGDLVSSLGTQIEKIDDKISQLESRIKYKRSLI